MKQEDKTYADVIFQKSGVDYASLVAMRSLFFLVVAFPLLPFSVMNSNQFLAAGSILIIICDMEVYIYTLSMNRGA